MVYAFSWYLNSVCESWDALVEGDYEKVFPLPYRKKAGIYYLYQPPFTQQLGIFSTGKLTENIVRNFLEAIPARFKLIEINLNAFNTNLLPQDSGTYYYENQNFELDLISPYETLRRGYSKNLKRNLKNAGKYPQTLVKNLKPEPVISLFRKHRGKKIGRLRDHEYNQLTRLTYTAMYRGRATVWGIFDATNNLDAGAIFIKSKHKWIFLFSGTSDNARKTSAMPFLIDQFIREHSGSHTTLDFEGSNNKNLARFYAGFGATLCTYPQMVRNSLPWYANLPLKGIKKIKEIKYKNQDD
jgi:hypothetical protein